jgi:hypothetical protein
MHTFTARILRFAVSAWFACGVIEVTVSTQPNDQVACESAPQCAQQAGEAIAAGDYERSHSLAWRAIQKGKSNDTTLMYLVARTQSLSGRPHDALVMLRRLAQLGFRAQDAETSDEFRRVRSLAEWPEILAVIRAIPSDRADVETEMVAPSAINAPREAPADRLAIPRVRSVPVALAYDGVSRRFVFADESSDTLKVVDELTGNVVNLVSEGWAGAYRTTALAIDSRRGDLWVAGVHQGADGTAQSVISRLQLVSGRRLQTIELPADAGSSRVIDITVGTGRVFVLDALGQRVYSLVPGAKLFERGHRVDVVSPTGIAVTDEGVLYISGAKGVVRFDVNTRRTLRVGLGNLSDRGVLQSLVWQRGTLVGIQRSPDGESRAVRMMLDARGRTVTSSETLAPAASRAITVSGGTFYFLAASSSEDVMIKQLQISDSRKN